MWERLLFALTMGLVVSVTVYSETNHNAVLICGDVPGSSKLLSLQGMPQEELAKMGIWNDGIGITDQRSYNEFWNDTYLMWEVLWETARYKLYGTTRPTDRIHVLFGAGDDWGDPSPNPRYKYTYHSDWNDNKITDYPAYYADVENIFTWLRDGNVSQNIEPLTDKDNLFCWTFNHGTGPTLVRALDISDPSSFLVTV